MELKIVLQTKYEAVHAIFPSVPERNKTSIKQKHNKS
jgi:hypothetical protein